MLNYITVDGFKSLTNFKMELHEGLNILVGPNGSGKTNIISFFEFLGNLQEMTVPDAICGAGGAGFLFTKAGENKYRASMTCSVAGNIRVEKGRILFYRYSFTIGIRDSMESITYHSQRLQAKYKTVVTKPGVIPRKLDLDVETTLDKQNDSRRVTINYLNSTKIRSHLPYRGFTNSSQKDRVPLEKQLKKHFDEYSEGDDSLIRDLRYFFEGWRYIYFDLKCGKVFNIVPSQVRIPEDSAKTPGIRENGSGLYSTLYAIKRHRPERRRHRYIHSGDSSRYIVRTTIDSILKYMRLANESISKIDVFNDPFDNQLQVRIWIGSEKESTVLPLSAMSDGTIKWLSLITIILTSRTMYSIEEPENYLHPLMQAEILAVMRSTMPTHSFTLLSTHSETILNHALPEEVVVTSLKDGVTTATRPKNAKELREEIELTGFGLGYYYMAGSLDDE